MKRALNGETRRSSRSRQVRCGDQAVSREAPTSETVSSGIAQFEPVSNVEGRLRWKSYKTTAESLDPI
jgi:hypothetical protein